jgi:uncharacterized protein
MTPNLGNLPIDLPRLLETRMLVQANSGGGKSWCLRRLLEQTAGQVQQIVIDPEGEFASLRERFDYIVCAPNGADAVANPQTAAALARALWKAGTSAILDVYELKAHERVLFVRRFLESLVNAPRAIWHPTLVVLDEAHVFAPQVGSAESLGAVVDLATRGRKRGLALIAATQRLSKLHKDVAAELLNKLVGRTGLDVDVQRAADELGMNRKDSIIALRNLQPGTFFAFGPALSPTVEPVKVGPVQTTHPKTGHRELIAPPPPSPKVLAQLAKLEGVQREVEREQQTTEQLLAEVATLRRKLTIAEKNTSGAKTDEAEVQRRIREAVAAAAPAGVTASKTLRAAVEKIAAGLQAMQAELAGVPVDIVPRARTVVRTDHAPAPRNGTPSATVDGLRAGAVRILQELAARAPAGYSRPQVGGLTQFAHKGGTFTTYIGDLRRSGFIEERGGLMYATEAGIAALGDKVPAAPTSHDEAMALWRKALRSGAFAMLEAIVAAGRDGISRDDVAAAVGMTASGGTFTTYLGDLRRNGLITEQHKRCTANDILFPKGRA